MDLTFRGWDLGTNHGCLFVISANIWCWCWLHRVCRPWWDVLTVSLFWNTHKEKPPDDPAFLLLCLQRQKVEWDQIEPEPVDSSVAFQGTRIVRRICSHALQEPKIIQAVDSVFQFSYQNTKPRVNANCLVCWLDFAGNRKFSGLFPVSEKGLRLHILWAQIKWSLLRFNWTHWVQFNDKHSCRWGTTTKGCLPENSTHSVRGGNCLNTKKISATSRNFFSAPNPKRKAGNVVVLVSP